MPQGTQEPVPQSRTGHYRPKSEAPASESGRYICKTNREADLKVGQASMRGCASGHIAIH